MIYLFVTVWYILGLVYFIHTMRKDHDVNFGMLLIALVLAWIGVFSFLVDLLMNIDSLVVFKKYDNN